VQSGANIINMSFDMTSNSLEFSKAMDYANQKRRDLRRFRGESWSAGDRLSRRLSE